MNKNFEGVEKPVVFVIDDQPIICFGFAEMINDIAPQSRIRQFSSLKDAARHAIEEFPSLIISDFHLRDVHSDTFFGLFETLFPGIPVLITANDDKVMGQLKRHQLDRFVAFSRELSIAKLFDMLRIGLRRANIELLQMPILSKHLTQKQVEVLELIGAGHSNKEIASCLKISVETVKGHVKDILERLQAKNRVEASIIYRQTQIQKLSAPEPSLLNY